MFKFMTIVFFIAYLIKLLRDPKSWLKSLKELYSYGYMTKESISDEMSSNKDYFNMIVIKFLSIIWAIVFLLSEFIYLLNAFKYDILKYPTILMIVYLVFNVLRMIIKNKIKSIGLTEEEKFVASEINVNKNIKSNMYTFKIRVIQVLNIVYYTYMLWILFIR